MEKTEAELKENIAQLKQNYQEMSEEGKEKLAQVSNQVLKIWETVNENKTENRV